VEKRAFPTSNFHPAGSGTSGGGASVGLKATFPVVVPISARTEGDVVKDASSFSQATARVASMIRKPLAKIGFRIGFVPPGSFIASASLVPASNKEIGTPGSEALV